MENQSEIGAAIYLGSNSNLDNNSIISNSVIDRNTSSLGGALSLTHLYGNLTIQNCSISNNNGKVTSGILG